MHGITKLFGRNIETANNFKACVMYVRTAARLAYSRHFAAAIVVRAAVDRYGVGTTTTRVWNEGPLLTFNSSLFFPSIFLIFFLWAEWNLIG